jgi:xanthine/uracil permease
MILVGVGNILSGAVGVIGPVDYSLSPGIVASTRCASRYTVIPAGLAMIAIAFSPTIVGFLMSIPSPVMGTVLLFLVATQLAAGFEMVRSTGSVTELRHGMILALPLLYNVIMTFAPTEAISSIPQIIRPLVGNGFVMGVIIILLLEHIFLRDKRDK